MTSRSALADFAARSVWPAICVAIAAYFAFHAIAGNSGLLAWRDYVADRQQLMARSATVARQRQALEHQSALLDPRRVDPDLADELVRRNLGVVGPDEVVVALPKAD